MKPNRDDQRKVVGALGLDGTANVCEPLINVVNTNKPNTLTGLNQNGTWDGLWVFGFPQHSHQRPPANRRNLPHPLGYAQGTW